MSSTGRPRAVVITLAAGYKANSSGRLIKEPDKKPDTPWRPQEVQQSTDLDGVKPWESLASLEHRAFFGGKDPDKAAKAEAKIRKDIREQTVRMKLGGDPLGLLTGEYRNRPKTFPTQPTPERVRQAKQRGEVLDKRPVLSDKGEELGESITEIVPQLRMLWRKGTINRDEFTAAIQLCKDWYGSGFRGAATVQYDKIRVDGGGGNYESDHVIACRQRFARAVVALGLDAAEVTAWLIRSMGDGDPLYELGRYYARSPEELQSQTRLSTRGGEELRTVLRDLCKHYGIDPSRRRGAKLSPTAMAIVAIIPEERAG